MPTSSVKRIIIGIDPGYDRCGVAVLCHADHDSTVLYSHTITTHKTHSLGDRLIEVRLALLEVITRFEPKEAAFEKLFFARNSITALHVAEALGVIRLTLRESGLTVSEYTPMQVKLATTGYGGSDKKAVMLMTKKLLRMDSSQRFDDELDAVAVALTHAVSSH